MVTLRADIAGTRPTANIEPPTPVASNVGPQQEIFSRLAQIILGKQLQAEVLSRLDDGTFLVRVADTPARLTLPEGTKIGDKLLLTMLAHTPRPTFLLNAATGGANTTLSTAGQLIDTALQLAQRNGAETALHPTDPLLPSPQALVLASATPQVAAALHDTLHFSGLFYESHLEEWVAGARTPAELMREPQARNAVAPAQVSTPMPTSTPTGALPTPPSELTAHLAELLNTALPLASNQDVTDADTVLPPSHQHDAALVDTMRLVPLQLHTLEQQQIVWHGQLFPGQPMEWSVNEDAPHRDAEPGEQTQWQSAVRFELPALGAVSATIVLSGEHVHIQVRTATETAADALRTHGPALADALAAAGSSLDSLRIEQDEKT